MIIVLLHCSLRCATRVWGGFLFPERRKGFRTSKFTRPGKQVRSEWVYRNIRELNPLCLTVLKASSCSHSRRTQGTIYLYHVLGETQLPVPMRRCRSDLAESGLLNDNVQRPHPNLPNRDRHTSYPTYQSRERGVCALVFAVGVSFAIPGMPTYMPRSN